MRKALALTLALLLLLTACGGPDSGNTAAPTASVTADQVAQAALDSQSNPAGLTPLTGNDCTDYLAAVCGIPEEMWTQAAVYTASGVDAREIIILRLSEEADRETVTNALELHRQTRLGDFFGYAPDQAALMQEAVVAVLEGYAALLACQEPEAALAALEELLGGGAPPELAPEPTMDVEAFAPFDPPNEHDMTLYDTSAILAAWESGEESGLSQQDAAILACCREIMEENLTEGMTDFQKELALHDALVRRGSYDDTVYDRDTPQGRPNNTNPYGLLVEGYGICLGYATSFQLLMDLAGVECITVVGASFGSTSDHAWNMVRLEGEWYCVDPTWNDPTGWDRLSDNQWQRIHHSYFNVTSDEMRQSDHQWDYANVPEATATRFFWDGTGRLPS